MIILKKLNNFDIHYSVQGVNQRLNRIIRDSIFTYRLSFIKQSSGNFIDRLSDQTILDRFCSQILPEIHDKIERLDLESTSMKTVLHAADFSKLHCLGLYNINEELIRSLVTGKILFIQLLSRDFVVSECLDQTLSAGIFKNNITILILTCIREEDFFKMLSSVRNIFECIFPMFMKLTYLILHESSYKDCVRLNFDCEDPSFLHLRSSTLRKLKINIQSFNDCLYILDGRFNQLDTLIIDLVNLRDRTEIENQVSFLQRNLFR